MTNSAAILQLPLDSGRSVRLGAESGAGSAFLRTLASVLQLECRECEDLSGCRAVLASQTPSASKFVRCRRMMRSGENLVVYPMIRKHRRESEALQLRALLCGAVALEMLYRPGSFALMHGTLLEERDGGILLFGTSGIGKSTTRNRYIAEGGVSVADDAVLCYTENGEFYARRLPTWSDWFANGSTSRTYPVSESIKIKDMLWLSRGSERQEIVSTSYGKWHAQLMSALVLHCHTIMRSFSNTEAETLMNTMWEFILKLDAKFPPRTLQAHLDYPLMPTLLTGVTK